MALTLTRRVAEMIDRTAFGCTPEMYGLTTQDELERRTYVGPARRIATDKAREIIAVVRAEILQRRS